MNIKVSKSSVQYWLSRVYYDEPSNPVLYYTAIALAIFTIPFVIVGEILLNLTYILFKIINQCILRKGEIHYYSFRNSISEEVVYMYIVYLVLVIVYAALIGLIYMYITHTLVSSCITAVVIIAVIIQYKKEMLDKRNTVIEYTYDSK